MFAQDFLVAPYRQLCHVLVQDETQYHVARLVEGRVSKQNAHRWWYGLVHDRFLECPATNIIDLGSRVGQLEQKVGWKLSPITSFLGVFEKQTQWQEGFQTRGEKSVWKALCQITAGIGGQSRE